MAILGGGDTGSAGAIPVWQRANLAYLGGVPFTPVESNYKNAVIFDDVSVADNAAASVYAAKTLGAKTAAIIYTSDTQGTSVADNVHRADDEERRVHQGHEDPGAADRHGCDLGGGRRDQLAP